MPQPKPHAARSAATIEGETMPHVSFRPALLLAALTLTVAPLSGHFFPVSTIAVAQDADRLVPASGGWTTYVNGRFGASLAYPADVFGDGNPSDNGDGRSFASEDAQLEVFGWENAEGETAGSLKNRLVGTNGYENVTYSRSGGSWLVLSGFRGDNIFYEKYFFRGNTIQAFGIEFPRDEKPFYAPIVEGIEDSFRAG